MSEATKKNKVHYDLKNVHFAPITEAEDGTVSFGVPVREYGAISMDMAPVGDSGKLRADGIDYYTFNSNGGYEGDVNFAQVSELFRRTYHSEVVDDMSRAILFPSTEKEFLTQGLGVLTDAISCEVTEERNGAFELTMVYPVTGIHYDEICERRIILQ